MRTRWLVMALGISLVLNVLFGTAFWQCTRTCSLMAAGVPTVALASDKARLTCPAGCPEERKIRENLTGLLSAERPDRTALSAAMARLDAVRAVERDRLLDRWLSHCAKATPVEREELRRQLHHALCPWNAAGEGNRAPSTGEKGKSAQPQS